MMARIPVTERRRHKSTEPRVTLPVGLIGVVLTILSRADILPFIAERAQGYILGGAAVATLVGVLDLWEEKKDAGRFIRSKFR